jgi:hypothetical protein
VRLASGRGIAHASQSTIFFSPVSGLGGRISYRIPLMLADSKLQMAALAGALFALGPAPALAEHGSRPLDALIKIVKGVAGTAREIDRDAMRAFESAPRPGSCAERRERFLEVLPEALRLARLARDIGEQSQEAKMRAEGLATLDLGGGRTAHFQASGRRYAEVGWTRSAGRRWSSSAARGSP